MLYLIIKTKDGQPSPGCQDWYALHSNLEDASASLRAADDPAERIDVIEINPVERSWRPYSTLYGSKSPTVTELVRTIPDRQAKLPPRSYGRDDGELVPWGEDGA